VLIKFCSRGNKLKINKIFPLTECKNKYIIVEDLGKRLNPRQIKNLKRR